MPGVGTLGISLTHGPPRFLQTSRRIYPTSNSAYRHVSVLQIPRITEQGIQAISSAPKLLTVRSGTLSARSWAATRVAFATARPRLGRAIGYPLEWRTRADDHMEPAVYGCFSWFVECPRAVRVSASAGLLAVGWLSSSFWRTACGGHRHLARIFSPYGVISSPLSLQWTGPSYYFQIFFFFCFIFIPGAGI